MTIKPTIFKAVLLMAVTVFLNSSCQYIPPVQPPGTQNSSLFQKIANDSRFRFLTAALTKAGLVATLNDKNASLTLFAPTDQAFQAAGFSNINAVANAPAEVLKSILLYHVLGSVVKSGKIPLATNTQVNTVANKPVFVTRTNAGNVFVNGVTVIQKDWEARNGVIHVIDRVLIPSVGTIVQTAQTNDNLSLLVAAVLRASQGTVNVASVLNSNGPFTVFAPTNQAFKNAGFASIDAIQSTDPEVLISILTYHVIGARIFSSDLTEGAEPATVNGGKVKISLSGGPKVKGKTNSTASNIVSTNIVATNGVIHVIDQVLLP